MDTTRVMGRGVLALALAATGMALAAAPVLGMKPGAWEVAVTMDMGGKPHKDVVKVCYTAQEIQKNNVFGGMDEGCTQRIVAATSTLQKISLQCEEGRSGSASFSLAAPTQFKAVVDTQGGGQAKSHIEQSGRWIGASCAGIE